MQTSPLLEHWTQPDDVQERFLTPQTSDRRAVVRVEVAMHGNAARLGESNRLFDLAALKVLFAHRCRWDGTRTGCTASGRAPAQGESPLRRCGPPPRARGPRRERRQALFRAPRLSADRTA